MKERVTLLNTECLRGTFSPGPRAPTKVQCPTLWDQCRFGSYPSQTNKNASTWKSKEEKGGYFEITKLLGKALFCSSKFLSQSSTTFTSCYTCTLQPLVVCHAAPLPEKLSLPMPLMLLQRQFKGHLLFVTFTSTPRKNYSRFWSLMTITTLISFLSSYQFLFPMMNCIHGIT